MVNFCSKCGTQLPEGIKFCPKCGTPQAQTPAQPQPQQPATPPPQQSTPPPSPPPQQTYQPQPQQPATPPPQQQPPQQTYQPQPQQNYQQQSVPNYAQTQPYAPKPKKSHTKLIIGIVAIIAIIVIVLLLVFFVFGGSDGRFVGKWEQDSILGTTFEWEFESDGDLKISGVKAGTWEEKDDQLCLRYTGATEDVCYDYKFSNNDKKLELKLSGATMITLNKK